jgi:uncharacterized protein (TIGR02996 family)
VVNNFTGFDLLKKEERILNQETAFLTTLRQQPDDDVTRLVFADWLDEQGGKANRDKSAFLRLQCQLANMQDSKTFLKATLRLTRMAKKLDRAWLRIVTRPPIENCDPVFEFQCPKRWDKLQPTRAESVRFCDACQKNVYFCQSVQEARAHTWQEHCVAICPGVKRKEGDVTPYRIRMGRIALPRIADLPELDDEGPPIRGERRRSRRRRQDDSRDRANR